MIDLQSEKIENGRAIDGVGIRGLRYPIVVADKTGGQQATVASVDIYASLPPTDRATHMSRFVEILHQYRCDLSDERICDMLRTVKSRLGVEAAAVIMSFPYFLLKKAPLSKIAGFMSYDCQFTATIDGADSFSRTTEVCVPVLNVCPCSKQISIRGAHNQRTRVTIRIKASKLVCLEDIIVLAESCASSPLYSVLKRDDEKYVTEQSYEQPRFVEDIVRAVASGLEKWLDIDWYRVEAESYESIHSHNAHAYLQRPLQTRSRPENI